MLGSQNSLVYSPADFTGNCKSTTHCRESRCKMLKKSSFETKLLHGALLHTCSGSRSFFLGLLLGSRDLFGGPFVGRRLLPAPLAASAGPASRTRPQPLGTADPALRRHLVPPNPGQRVAARLVLHPRFELGPVGSGRLTCTCTTAGQRIRLSATTDPALRNLGLVWGGLEIKTSHERGHGAAVSSCCELSISHVRRST